MKSNLQFLGLFAVTALATLAQLVLMGLPVSAFLSRLPPTGSLALLLMLVICSAAGLVVLNIYALVKLTKSYLYDAPFDPWNVGMLAVLNGVVFLPSVGLFIWLGGF